MKITKKRLKQIVQEELQKILETHEEPPEEPGSEPDPEKTKEKESILLNYSMEDIAEIAIEKAEQEKIIPMGGDYSGYSPLDIYEVIASAYRKKEKKEPTP